MMLPPEQEKGRLVPVQDFNTGPPETTKLPS